MCHALENLTKTHEKGNIELPVKPSDLSDVFGNDFRC